MSESSGSVKAPAATIAEAPRQGIAAGQAVSASFASTTSGGAGDSLPRESFVDIAGSRCRIWEKGDGAPLGFLPGLRGLPRWTPFLDRLAEKRRVVAMSPPGFSGSAPGHHHLDDLADWVTMTLDLLEAAGVAGFDLIGSSAGGILAAEAAAFSNASVRKLVLIDSFGLYDDAVPPVMFFANTPPEQDGLLTADASVLRDFTAAPPGLDDSAMLEWDMQAFRVNEATARLVWPMGDHGLRKRLHRIRSRTLVLWGAQDKLFPASYAALFEQGIAGATRTRILKGAGHLAWLDRPEETAAAVLRFVGTPRLRRPRAKLTGEEPSPPGIAAE
jgi:pimeloyl-ACP methyl ester carboxylesterase